MLRKKLQGVFKETSQRTKLARVMKLLTVVSVLWILAFPYTSEEVETQENGLDGSFLESMFRDHPLLLPIFDKYKRQIEDLDTPEGVKDFLTNELRKSGETFNQRLDQGGSNIYTYARSKDGPGNECLALAVPLNLKPSLVFSMTFLQMMRDVEPDWQSKDLIVLFYEQNDHSLAVKDWLDSYYSSKGKRKPTSDPF
jgi:hypothetical protein